MPCSDHRSTITETSGPTELGVGSIADGEYLRRSGDEIVGAAGGGGGGATASTTETLTGTDSSKSVTPDSLAALWEQGSDIASAAPSPSARAGSTMSRARRTSLTSTSGPTEPGDPAVLRFDDTLTLAHGANLICPEARDLRVHENDVVTVVSEGSDVVRVVG